MMNKYPHFMQRNFLNRRMFSTLYNYRDAKNPVVFFKVSKNGEPLGQMTFEVIYKIIIITFKYNPSFLVI